MSTFYGTIRATILVGLAFCTGCKPSGPVGQFDDGIYECGNLKDGKFNSIGELYAHHVTTDVPNSFEYWALDKAYCSATNCNLIRGVTCRFKASADTTDGVAKWRDTLPNSDGFRYFRATYANDPSLTTSFTMFPVGTYGFGGNNPSVASGDPQAINAPSVVVDVAQSTDGKFTEKWCMRSFFNQASGNISFSSTAVTTACNQQDNMKVHVRYQECKNKTTISSTGCN